MRCGKIFIIEDDEEIRSTLHSVFEDEGYVVESFRNGQEAIVRLTVESDPCLILLDMMMPVMNGVEFMHAFHGLKATIVPIPVYLVSATSDSKQASDIGCHGFIKKPMAVSILLNIARAHCLKW
jgi:CheY-like chemotaxis protein